MLANCMKQLIISYYYDSYERTKEHLIVTKRVGEIPQLGDVVKLQNKEYEIVQADYDYEVCQSSGVMIYDVIVSEILRTKNK